MSALPFTTIEGAKPPGSINKDEKYSAIVFAHHSQLK